MQKLTVRKRILGTLFLRAIGLDSREKIVDHFYKSKEVTLSKEIDENNDLVGAIAFTDIYSTKGGKKRS